MKIPSLFQSSILMMVILGALLRLFGYPNIPPELNRDEAALGYNAYAILTEGVDEWGVAYPVIFRSFGDMKLPGYIYTLVPFVASFGLENWVVRLPSLLAGIGLIWLVIRFALLLGLTKKASLFAGLIVAVSPWALHYGTTAFEANLALAFFLFFLMFLLSPGRGQKRTMIGGLFLLLSLLTYNAPLVLTPFILVFAVLSRTTTLRKGIFFGLIAVCAVLITAPASQGKANIGLWTDPGLVERVNQLRMQEQGSLIGRLVHRPFVAVIPQILQNHVQAYSWNFLVNGVMFNPWHVIGRLGFVTPEVYGLAAGGVVLCVVGIIRRGVHRKRFSRGALWIVFLMVIAPLPASLTRDAPHATRSLLLFVAFALATGWGVDQVLRVGQKISARFVSVLFLCLVAGLCVRGISVAQARVNLSAGSYNREWWVDSRRVFSESETLRDAVGVVGDLHYAYIYPLFFGKVKPSDLRATMTRGPSDSNGLTDVLQLGRYVFFSSSRDIPPEVGYYIEQTAPGQFELKKK